MSLAAFKASGDHPSPKPAGKEEVLEEKEELPAFEDVTEVASPEDLSIGDRVLVRKCTQGEVTGLRPCGFPNGVECG
eukprot:g2750.t1